MSNKMKVFYGGAIQGSQDREKRRKIHQSIIESIKELGFDLVTEHSTARNFDESTRFLEKVFGPLPKDELERRIAVRNKMIESVEGDIYAAVFEVSEPSLGTGVEIAHAYLRPRLGLKEIPIIALYQTGFWPNKLSTMVRGIKDLPNFKIIEYKRLEEIKEKIQTNLR
jgi:hypothetical protein